MAFWTGTRWVPLNPKPPAVAPPRRTIRDVVATGLMIVILLAIAVPFDGASGLTPALTANPTAGPPGTSVLVRGSGLTPRSQLELRWDTRPAGWREARVGKDGTFSVTIVVPDASAGAHSLSAVPRHGNRFGPAVAFTTFEVAAPTAGPAGSPPPTAAPATPTPPASGSPTSPSPDPMPSTPSGSASPSTAATPSPTIQPPPSTPAPTPVPTLAPTPAPVAAPAKLLFGIGPEADGAVNLPIVRDAPVGMLTSWFNRHGDLAWMSGWRDGNIPNWVSQGYVVHLIVYDAGPESQHGAFCGKDYLFSSQFDADMQALAQVWARAGSRLYVTLFSEFQTYACPDANQYVGSEAFYAALKAKYRTTMAAFHRYVPGSHVSLGWGGWQARWDDPAKGGGRSLFRHLADVMAESDFQSFQAMQNDGNASDIPAMTSWLAAYGPVMLAHYKPDSGNQAVWTADMHAIFTDAFIANLVARGLFAFSFMDERNMNASSAAYDLARSAVVRYGR